LSTHYITVNIYVNVTKKFNKYNNHIP